MCNFLSGFSYGFYRPSFGTMLLASRGIDPMSTCYADLDSPSGFSSFVPSLNYQLNRGNYMPLICGNYGGFGGLGFGGLGFGGISSSGLGFSLGLNCGYWC